MYKCILYHHSVLYLLEMYLHCVIFCMVGHVFISLLNARQYILLHLSKWQAIYCYIILKTSKWQAMYDGEECSVGKATVVAADEECKVRSLCNCNCGCFCSFLLESSFDIKQCTADSKYKSLLYLYWKRNVGHMKENYLSSKRNR